jgi:NAD(P)H-hydrate epimerase
MDIPAVTTEQMAEVDRLMIEEYGIQLIQMMENAGRNLAELARRTLHGSLDGQKIVVQCGGGNNGGGGMVAARHLHNWGASVGVQLTTEEARLKEVPAHQWKILKSMQVTGIHKAFDPAHKPDLIIDAILGYGLQGNPRGEAAKWIDWANDQDCPVLALDAPSGLDTTSGTAGTPTIQATSTLTLALPKTGLLKPEAKEYVGKLYLADISVPRELYRRMGIEVGTLFGEDTIVEVQK